MRTTLGVARRRKKNRLFQKAKGYTGGRGRLLPQHQGNGRPGRGVCLPRPPRTQARIPQAVDHPHQRGRPRTRPALQRVHQRPASRRRSSSTARVSRRSPSPIRPRSTRLSPRRKRRWRKSRCVIQPRWSTIAGDGHRRAVLVGLAGGKPARRSGPAISFELRLPVRRSVYGRRNALERGRLRRLADGAGSQPD